MAKLGMNDLRSDMQVYTSDAAHVGQVKLIRDEDILIDREMQRDIFVPLNLVAQVLPDEERVELRITEHEFQDTDWEHPDFF